MQTKFKIVETESYLLAVSDEKINEFGTNLKEGTKVFYNLTGYETIFIKTAFNICNGNFQSEFCKKIIAYKPKNNTPELDLPLLPEMVVEDNVEIKINNALSYWNTFEGEYQKGIAYGLGLALEYYKAATKTYSEEDLINLVAYIANFEDETDGNIASSGRMPSEIVNSFIQSLKQPKWFVAEMETPYTDAFTEDRIRRFYGKPKLKTTTINGKTYLVGKYLNE
jgi:hypothetical protein